MIDIQSSSIGGHERPVSIPYGRRRMDGLLASRRDATGIVVIAHGVGGAGHSPRGRYIARVIQCAGLATLTLDLLGADEPEHARIELLADRLLVATTWLARAPCLRHLPLGFFGAGQGGAAALFAAARRPDCVESVACRSGRPELARDVLPSVRSPTLLIVGGRDGEALEPHRAAMGRLRCSCDLVIVPGASQHFREHGALEEVAHLAERWFLWHLGRDSCLLAPQTARRGDPSQS